MFGIALGSPELYRKCDRAPGMTRVVIRDKGTSVATKTRFLEKEIK